MSIRHEIKKTAHAEPAPALTDIVGQEDTITELRQRLAATEADIDRLAGSYREAAKAEALGDEPSEEAAAEIQERIRSLSIRRDGLTSALAESEASLARMVSERNHHEAELRERHRLAEFEALVSRLRAEAAEAEQHWDALSVALWRMSVTSRRLYDPSFMPEQGANLAGSVWQRFRGLRTVWFNAGRKMLTNTSIEVVAMEPKGEV